MCVCMYVFIYIIEKVEKESYSADFLVQLTAHYTRRVIPQHDQTLSKQISFHRM